MRRSQGQLALRVILVLSAFALFSDNARTQNGPPGSHSDQAARTVEHSKVGRLVRGAEELRQAGKYTEALELAREALAISLENDGGDSLAAARALTLVAQIYMDQGNYFEAEPLFRRALEIDKAMGAEAAEIAAAQENLKLASEKSRPNATRVGDKQEGGEDGQGSPHHHRFERRSFDAKRIAPDAGSSQKSATEWDVVPIFYGTDRQQEPNPKRVDYNDERAHRLELGRALVTVPKNHQVPNIERPWSLHIPYFDVTFQGAEDPKEHFTLQEVKVLSKSGFLALVRERLASSSRFSGDAFVFVHGYNTSFENALYRTAQIANDLEFDGAPFLYSWPSGGAIASYGRDRECAEGARDHLREFLEMVAHDTGAKSISIIAHSMGNIALLNVLREMNRAPPQGVAISQIILAAPDVSVDDFVELADSIKGLSKGVTLYASSNDRALQISRGIWGSYRAGDVPPDGPVLAKGVDTIDVTKSSTEVFALNHSGYAQNNDLLADVGTLIEKGLHPPEARSTKLHPVASAKGGYWQYQP